jgi:microcystin-dependent protein
VSWLTPNTVTGGGVVSRPLYIPEQFVSQVTGALLSLTEIWNWEEYGDMTPEDCVQVMLGMLEGYFMGNPLIGAVNYYANAQLPPSCLPCDGSVYARIDYPDLYSVIDSAFIIDADTFRTPPMADRFILASSSNIGQTGGEASHVLTGDEMPPHSHSIPYQSCFPYGDIPEVCVVGGVLTQQTGETGGGLAHNNMPPYIRLRAGIVYI